jgi:hypothetical protein
MPTNANCSLDQTELTPAVRKPDVPRAADAPKHGLVTTKNFVVYNAVAAILSSNKHKEERDSAGVVRYVKKKDFGMSPKYLQRVKASIAMEHDILKEYFEVRAGDPPTEGLPEEDRAALINQLKRKWGAVNHNYAAMCGGAPSNSKNQVRLVLERLLCCFVIGL